MLKATLDICTQGSAISLPDLIAGQEIRGFDNGDLESLDPPLLDQRSHGCLECWRNYDHPPGLRCHDGIRHALVRRTSMTGEACQTKGKRKEQAKGAAHQFSKRVSISFQAVFPSQLRQN